jgi:serine/threonine-protein kinase RsbW
MVHKIRVPCLRNNLKRIREFVESVLKPYQNILNPLLANQMVVAVDELCSNIIIHSHNCNPSEKIDIVAYYDQDRFTFQIIDENALPYDICQHECTPIEEIVKNRQRGGMGVMLIKNIMDEVHIYRQDDKNVYRITKKLS